MGEGLCAHAPLDSLDKEISVNLEATGKSRSGLLTFYAAARHDDAAGEFAKEQLSVARGPKERAMYSKQTRGHSGLLVPRPCLYS